ncbi:MAG TPA: DUF5714 domain-containing protein [Anaerovoracaceae bacterium]|nr:DUF5714 domain-containing protein [Anaerovoracaceae bacterium]
MKFELKQEVYDNLTNMCISAYKNQEHLETTELLNKLMNLEGLPMHCPYHHYILPAALLTLCAIDEKRDEDKLTAWLNTAEERAKTVPGGFCGNCGTCGSAVGLGIFTSVYTGSSPMSVESWQWANEVTGIGLQKIASYPGPRCCKRTSYLALQAGVPYINEHCRTSLDLATQIKCSFHDKNAECLGEDCPFYSKENQ